MASQRKIIGLAVIFGLAVWVIDAMLDYFIFYNGSFWGLLLTDIPKHEIYIRSLILVLFLCFGIIVAAIVGRLQRAQSALKESETTLKTLLEAAPIGIGFVTDRRIGWINRTFCRMTGYSDDELIGQSARIVYHSDAEFERAGKVKHPNILGESVGSIETRLRHKDGTSIDVLVGSAAIVPGDLSGGLVFTAMDVSEVKLLEEEWDRLFNLSIDMLCVLGFDGFFKRMNPAWTQTFGWSDEELLGRPAIEFVHPEDRDRAVAALRQLQDGKQVYSFENRHICRDGSFRWISWNLVPIAEDKLIFGVVRDVTDQKRAEDRLRFANRALSSLSACSAAMVRAATEMELIQEVCRIIVEVGGYRLAWVGFPEDDDRQSVRTVAGWGYEEGYRESLNITWSYSEMGLGPAGTAIRTGEPANVRNIHSDPAFEPWRAEAAKRGYASLLALPLTSDGIRLGALTIYAEEPASFDEDETSFLSELSEDLSYGITSLRAREERRRAEKAQKESLFLLQTLMDAIPNPVFYKDVKGIYLGCNKAFEEFMGVPKERIVGKAMHELATEEMADRSRKKDVELLARQGTQVFDSSVEYPDGTQRYVTFHKATFSGFDGNLAGIIGVILDITERKQTEEALVESERRLSTLMRNLPGMAYRCRNDELWTMEFISDGCLDLTGYTPEDLIHNKKRSFKDLIHPDDRSRVWDQVQEAIAANEPFQMEYRIQTVSGETRWVWEQGMRVDRGPGEEAMLEGLMADITDRRKAEDALRESEEKYRLLFSKERDAILLTDAETRKILDLNEACEDLYGYSRDEYLSMFAIDLSAEPEKSKSFFGLANEPEGILIPMRLHRKKDGEVFPVEISAAPFTWRGQLVICSIIRDISERRQAEEERIRLVTGIEQAGDSITITDSDGAILFVNPAFEQISGYAKEEVLGRNPRILKSDKHDQAFYKEMWETLLRGEIWKGHFINKKKDGTLYHVKASISPIKDESGKITNYVAVKRDVTNEINMEQQLRQSQKMEAIGTLAGGIAHDFNNILTVITGFTELALENTPEEAEIRSDLEEVIQAGKRAADLVNQILAFSRLSEQEMAPTHVGPIVQEVVKFLRASLPTTIEIRPLIEPNVGAVMADPTQIHQVIINLCTNAGHAMRERGGLLEIDLRTVDLDSDPALAELNLPEDRHLKLTIRDTGTGISHEILDRIFEPYFTTKDKGEGTGLGLAVVHGIVKSYGGDIRVTSKPEEGTSFHVYLPKIQDAAISQTTADEARPGGKERILFVDDEPGITQMVKMMLERLGYDVVTRTSAVEALELFRGDPAHFDLLITDMTMPNLTGKDLAVGIMEIRPTIPIIICTGFSEQLTEEEADDMGLSAFLMKPLTTEKLAQTIRQVLDTEAGKES